MKRFNIRSWNALTWFCMIVYAAIGIWMNIPYYGLHDPATVWKSIDTDPRVIPQIYLMSGLPLQYHTTEIFPDGSFVNRQFSAAKLATNILIGFVAILCIPFTTQRRGKPRLLDLFSILSLTALTLALYRAYGYSLYLHVAHWIYLAPIGTSLLLATWSISKRLIVGKDHSVNSESPS